MKNKNNTLKNLYKSFCKICLKVSPNIFSNFLFANPPYAIEYLMKREMEKIYNKKNHIKITMGFVTQSIVIIGNYKNEEVKLKLEILLGHFKSLSIFNKQKIKITEELTLNIYTITKGYFEIKKSTTFWIQKVIYKIKNSIIILIVFNNFL